jgi:hypothetical protein
LSTDGQQKEKTIESQLAELRQQVAAAGHELVNEYIDDAALLVLPKRMALVTQPDWAARMKSSLVVGQNTQISVRRPRHGWCA